jgi:hypothetical protein
MMVFTIIRIVKEEQKVERSWHYTFSIIFLNVILLISNHLLKVF